jgi:anti-sigma factor ChrR (cupin superfamily)
MVELDEHALGVLPASESLALEAHVAECSACSRELAALRRTVESFTSWPTDVLRPSASLWSRLAARIALETGQPPKPAGTHPARWTKPDWKEVGPGISCKVLATDRVRARVSMLVRLAPGADYPPHTHAGVEELYLLDGELWINDRKFQPGDYYRAETGTADRRVWSETGCSCVLITSTRDRIA